MENIVQLYDEFVDRMEKGLATAQDAAECEIKIVQLYPSIAMKLRDAVKAHKTEIKKLAESTDPSTNKPMSGTKAEQVADASAVGLALLDAKTVADVYENFKYALKDYMQSLAKEWRES